MSQLYTPRPHQRLGTRFLREHARCNLFATPGCVDANTEYLSLTGWKRIADYQEGVVAQYLPSTESIEFVEPLGYIKAPCETMIRFKTARGVDQLLSPEHRVLYHADYSGRPKSGPRVSTALEFLHDNVPDAASFPCTAKAPDGWNLGMTEAQLRVQVATMADGYFPNKNARVAIRLKKQRKIDRLHVLLGDAGIEYTCKPCLPEGFVKFLFIAPRREKVYEGHWWGAGQQELEVIADEVWRWDGSIDRRRVPSKKFSAAVKGSADFVQWAFVATGHRTSLSHKTRERRGRTEHEYVVCATSNTTRVRLWGGSSSEANVHEEPSPDGFKYCFAVPSGFLLLRRNGCIFATGNSGKTSMVYSLLSVLRLAGSAYFPALVIAPKAVCELTWPAEALKWTQFNDLRIVQILGNERMRQDGILSWGDVYVINYENIPWLVQQYAGKPWPFRIVVADECFPAGTSIKIPGGEKPIEQLRVGDTVLSHEGPQRVEYLLTREVESFSLVSLKLSNGKTIRATKEHPFCTDLGWLPAKHCAGRRLYGMADLPNMPRGVSAAVRESGGSNAQRAYSILHEELSHQGDVQREPFFERGQRAFHAEAAKRAFGRLVMEQGKSLEPGAPRSDVSASASSRPGSYKTGWQRSRHEPDRSADCAAFAARLLMELDRAVGGRGAELSLALQAGLWKPDDKNVLGGGWKLPPYRARANARRKENCEVTVLGVEGVSNQERGRMELVYNLGVANAATYFAGGVLVHNCTRLKGFRSKQGTKRAKALSTIAQHTGRWINLTGTPAPNGYQDLWGQQWFIDFGQRLGDSYSKYMQRWFVENPYSHQVELRHPDCQKEIDRILGDCTLSIRAEDWMEVGKPNYIDREVRLPQQAMALYKQMERDFWIEIQQLEARHEVTAVNAAALSQKLLQIASGTVIHDGKVATHVHDAKIEALRSIAEELQEPLLVAYWYKAEEALLKKSFPEFRIFKSQQDEQDWNSGKIKLMGVHPQSAGHGVNLQYGGRAMVHFTHTWNAELREQVEARIGPVRQQAAGFNRAVVHYNLIAAGTLDRDVLDRVAGKISLQEALLRAHARMEEGY